MAIENTYLLGKNITLGCGFDLQAKAPLDSRQTVPSTAGLQALIDGNAAYEGMIVYDEESKKTYQAQIVDDVLTFREFGINEAELKDLIASETTAAMEFKGAATALPENPAKGDMYKVTASFKVGEEDVKVGDSIVYDGEQWFIIPSGDDIEDTWRPVTGVDNDSTLTFVAGDKLEKTVAADGTITYKHVAIDAPEDMTAEDDEKTRTYITQLITDNHGHIIGFKTATENVEDTNTEYTFEGQSDEATSVYFQVTSNEEGASAEVVYLDTYSKNEADEKFVAKEDGKGLSANDLTDELKGQYDDAYAHSQIAHAPADAQANVIETVKVNGEALEITEKAVDITVPTGALADKDEITKDDLAEALATEIDNKVEKETGKSLVSDDEIARLANVDNYDDEEVRGLIGDNTQAIDDLEGYVGTFTHDTAKTVVDYINAKTDGIATSGNLEALGQRVTANEGEIATLKGDVNKAGSVANSIDAAIKVLDLENTYVAQEDGKRLMTDAEGTKLAGISAEAKNVEASETNGKIKIDGVETVVYTHPEKHTVAEISDFDEKVKAYDYATKTEAQGYADAKDGAIEAAQKAADAAQEGVNDLKGLVGTNSVDSQIQGAIDGLLLEDTYAKKATTLAGYGIGDAYTKTETDTAVQDAKDYAKGLVDAIPAQTDYTVTITETTDGLANDIAKKYTFTQNGAEIGTINLAKELVVTSGSVKEVAEAGKPYAGAVVGDKYIELVIANQDAPIYVPAKDLVDIYTAKDLTTDSTDEVKIAISNTNEISATLVDGKIALSKLDADVQASLALADDAVQEEDIADLRAASHTHDFADADVKDAIAKKHEHTFTDEDVEDAISKEHTHNFSDEAALNGITAAKISEWDTAVAMVNNHDETVANHDADIQEINDKFGSLTTNDHPDVTTVRGAIDAAVADTEKYADDKVKALAEGQVNTNKEDIADLLNQLQWGEF